MLVTMDQNYNDIQGKWIADLGCGCGILSIGAAMLNAGVVVGFEVDPAATAIAYANCEEMGADIDIVQCNLASPELEDGMISIPWRSAGSGFDTVIMNPPFGTKKNSVGVDMLFLRRAVQLLDNGGGVIYSLHKSSTRAYIQKKATELGLEFEVVAELRYDLPASYKVHKKKSVDIEVDFLRFVKPPA